MNGLQTIIPIWIFMFFIFAILCDNDKEFFIFMGLVTIIFLAMLAFGYDGECGDWVGGRRGHCAR